MVNLGQDQVATSLDELGFVLQTTSAKDTMHGEIVAALVV
jgi:hypothetical protein